MCEFVVDVMLEVCVVVEGNWCDLCVGCVV